MSDQIVQQFETYQPATIRPNGITSPDCFNGYCLVRRYRVTVELIDEPHDVIKERMKRLLKTFDRGTRNYNRVVEEAKKNGIDLESK